MGHSQWSETQDIGEWDDFVIQNGGSIYHTWRWRKTLENIGTRPLYLASRDAKGALQAVCPFFYRNAGSGLRRLVSLPIAHVGGPVVDYERYKASTVMETLIKSLRFSISNRILFTTLRLHDQSLVESLTDLGFNYKATHALFILNLAETTPHEIWNNGFRKHERQAVKHYEKLNASFGLAREEIDYTNFWSLYQETSLRRGTQPRPSTFHSALRNNFGELFRVAVASLEGKMVAAQSLICDAHNSIVHFAMGGYSRLNNIHSPAVYLNWKIINWAAENRFRFVDLGPAESNPEDLVHKSKLRFCGRYITRYTFVLPTSATLYSMVRPIYRVQDWLQGT